MASTVEFRTAHEYGGSFAGAESRASGVSWGAVIAGAFVTAALSLILLALSTGIGLSSGALWSNASGSGAAGAGALISLIVIEAIASATGGYLAGRLRTKWTSIHTHEVYFRDTAHGFLVWAVAVVLTAGFLGTAAASMAGSAAAIATTGAAPTSFNPRTLDPNRYFADALFRSSAVAADRTDTGFRDQANLILLNGLRKGDLSAQDTAYLAQLVSAKTGMTQQEATQRVSDVFQQDVEDAQNTRSATAHSLYWMFVALLVGAFCASHAATVGGRQRDRGFSVSGRV